MSLYVTTTIRSTHALNCSVTSASLNYIHTDVRCTLSNHIHNKNIIVFLFVVGFVCYKYFIRLFSTFGLIDHLRIRCNQCDVICSSKPNLRRHIKSIHEGIKPATCSECGKSYEGNRSLAMHLLREHNILYKYK